MPPPRPAPTAGEKHTDMRVYPVSSYARVMHDIESEEDRLRMTAMVDTCESSASHSAHPAHGPHRTNEYNTNEYMRASNV